jgi:hypothetical protein
MERPANRTSIRERASQPVTVTFLDDPPSGVPKFAGSEPSCGSPPVRRTSPLATVDGIWRRKADRTFDALPRE